MATNLALDDHLIEEARRVGGHHTKKEAVTAALDEYVRRRKQADILGLFDSVDYVSDHNHRALRQLDRVEESQ